jgi:uncharacterized protein YdaL
MRKPSRRSLGTGAILLILMAVASAQTANHADKSAAIEPLTSLSATGPRALILYDGTSIGAHEGTVDGLYIANLMGHFSYRPTLQAIEDFKPGEMSKYSAVFVVGGSYKSVWPAALLREARARTTMLAWIGFGLDSFLSGGEDRKRGLRVKPVDLNTRFRQVRYRGTILDKGSATLTPIAVMDPSQVQLEATALDPEGHEVPYIVRRNQLWLVADVPFAYIGERDRYLVFCDLLHDMLGVNHQTSRRAMIRLEDVNPDDDAESVQHAVDVFVREGIPFQIGIIPVFIDPNAHKQIRLSENPELVAVLHKAVASGGTIILHGYTHQYRGVTADDFEFWDGMRNGPRGDDSAKLVRDKLTAALAECFRNEIYPVSWETPHYMASPRDYVEFGRVFSTLNEESAIDAQGSQQSYPYPTVDVRGLLIVPENIGYLPMDNPDPDRLIGNARAYLVVRDGIASAFVHDFLDPKLLESVVRGIKQLGYTFISIRDFPCRVSSPDKMIATHGAATDITLRDSYLRQFIIGRDGSRRGESWSDKRQTGLVHLTNLPAEGEILVAAGVDERRPASPGLAGRISRLVAGTVASLRQKTPIVALPETLKVAVVWNASAKGEEGNDQASLANLFRAYGVSPRMISMTDLRKANLVKNEVLVVPHAVAAVLGDDEVGRVAEWVRNGGKVLLDGRSKLAEATGVIYPGGGVEVGNITDFAEVDTTLQWQPSTTMERFHVPVGETILARDSAAEAAVAASFPFGAGIVLYVGTLFDPYTADGSSRYPFLFEHVLDAFQQTLTMRRRTMELYFDPGLRQGISIEDLAVQWRRSGVRAIYAAAWVFDKTYSYDYGRLIRVCHANGILVYAWFEFPQVSPLFWQQHPEWREVPAAGKTYPSWRLAMNFANPECRAAAMWTMTDVLNRWAWDGANLAELNFDGEGNGDIPASVVPMNDDFRRSFRSSYGFDPQDLFNRKSSHWWRNDKVGWNHYLASRTALVTEWHRTFLTVLRPFANSGHEVIVTMLDSLEHPEVTTKAGIDSQAIVKLLREFPFTLQVEDPMASWSDPPSRYLRLATRYRPLVPQNSRVMFDINVISGRNISSTHLPLALASGVELAATVRAARRLSDRVALYGDATVRSRDLELLAYAAADRASVTTHDLTWTVQTPDAIEVNLPSDLENLYRNGKEWPYRGLGFAILPPGTHKLTAPRTWLRLMDTRALRPQLMQISSPLISADTMRGHLVFQYDSPGPVLAGLSRAPAEVIVDGPPATVVHGAREIGAVVILPAGRHRVEITGSSGVAAFLDFAGLASSSIIVLFGTLAIAFLMALFLSIRVRRLFWRRGVRQGIKED